MFTYAIQQDTLKVEPADFDKDPLDALRDRINLIYANRVLKNVGLVICVLDFIDVGEGAALYGDGCLYYATLFRLIVFRPFIGQVLVGKVKDQNETSIRVSLEFFSDIEIPKHFLPENAAFDTTRQAYFWIYDPDRELVELTEEQSTQIEESPDEPLVLTPQQLLNYPLDQRAWVEKNKWIRFKVEQESFNDLAQPGGTISDKDRLIPPFQIVGSIADAGLGLLEWYDDD